MPYKCRAKSDVFLRGGSVWPTRSRNRELDDWWNDFVGIYTGGRSVFFVFEKSLQFFWVESFQCLRNNVG